MHLPHSPEAAPFTTLKGSLSFSNLQNFKIHLLSSSGGTCFAGKPDIVF
jgi:hypothetical protein